jgi:hypothetical protein
LEGPIGASRGADVIVPSRLLLFRGWSVPWPLRSGALGSGSSRASSVEIAGSALVVDFIFVVPHLSGPLGVSNALLRLPLDDDTSDVMDFCIGLNVVVIPR